MMLLLVMLGAAIGAPARWLLDSSIQARHERAFPWGTWTINVMGSFALGVLLSLAGSGHVTAEVVALLGTGFCGGFTTYSTFSFETIRLIEDGAVATATANVVASVGAAVAVAAAGWYLADALFGSGVTG